MSVPPNDDAEEEADGGEDEVESNGCINHLSLVAEGNGGSYEDSIRLPCQALLAVTPTDVYKVVK